MFSSLSICWSLFQISPGSPSVLQSFLMSTSDFNDGLLQLCWLLVMHLLLKTFWWVFLLMQLLLDFSTEKQLRLLHWNLPKVLGRPTTTNLLIRCTYNAVENRWNYLVYSSYLRTVLLSRGWCRSVKSISFAPVPQPPTSIGI